MYSVDNTYGYKIIIFKDFNIGFKGMGQMLGRYSFTLTRNFLSVKNLTFSTSATTVPLFGIIYYGRHHLRYNTRSRGVLRNERFNDEIKKEMREGF
jgi:hypothetical protein